MQNYRKSVYQNRENALKIYFQKILNITQICIFGLSKPLKR